MKKNIVFILFCISSNLFAFNIVTEIDTSLQIKDSLPKKEEFLKRKNSIGIKVGGQGGTIDISYGRSFYFNNNHKITARLGINPWVFFMAPSFTSNLEYQYNFKKTPSFFCKISSSYHLFDSYLFPVISINRLNLPVGYIATNSFFYVGPGFGYRFKKIEFDFNINYVQHLQHKKFTYSFTGEEGWGYKRNQLKFITAGVSFIYLFK